MTPAQQFALALFFELVAIAGRALRGASPDEWDAARIPSDVLFMKKFGERP